jgi:predicted dehydrogenase
VPQSGSADDVLAHPDVELVVNLTIPAVHAEVASRALAVGKHVWSEKPISVDLAAGRALLEKADAAGLLVGVAPDTVLGPDVQTARRAIARGDIGVPLSAQPLVADDFDHMRSPCNVAYPATRRRSIIGDLMTKAW